MDLDPCIFSYRGKKTLKKKFLKKKKVLYVWGFIVVLPFLDLALPPLLGCDIVILEICSF